MILALALLAANLSLLSVSVQAIVRRWRPASGALLFTAAALAGVFCAAALFYGAFSIALAVLAFAYFLGPTICVLAGASDGRANLFDLAAILLVWMPLELGIGENLVPRPVQGSLLAIASGLAMGLVLVLFLIYRRWKGMKYNIPSKLPDLGIAAAGFVCAVAALIPVGRLVGFIGPAHAPEMGPLTALARIGAIFAGTAFPEELLFRSLIQNWVVQQLGAANRALAIAAVIFGLSHLNNSPGPVPNWPYAIVATIAGFIFGQVFHRSTSILSSALVHTGVNTTKHLFF